MQTTWLTAREVYTGRRAVPPAEKSLKSIWGTLNGSSTWNLETDWEQDCHQHRPYDYCTISCQGQTSLVVKCVECCYLSKGMRWNEKSVKLQIWDGETNSWKSVTQKGHTTPQPAANCHQPHVLRLHVERLWGWKSWMRYVSENSEIRIGAKSERNTTTDKFREKIGRNILNC